MSHPSAPPAVHGSPWKPGISRSQVDQFSYRLTRLTRVGASLRVLSTLVLCHDDPPLVDVAAAATWHAERRTA